MKNLGKLKLNQLGKAELEKREMSQLTGGECCGCGCNGSYSAYDNATANYGYGYGQSAGGATMCANWGDDEWSDHC